MESRARDSYGRRHAHTIVSRPGEHTAQGEHTEVRRGILGRGGGSRSLEYKEHRKHGHRRKCRECRKPRNPEGDGSRHGLHARHHGNHGGTDHVDRPALHGHAAHAGPRPRLPLAGDGGDRGGHGTIRLGKVHPSACACGHPSADVGNGVLPWSGHRRNAGFEAHGASQKIVRVRLPIRPAASRASRRGEHRASHDDGGRPLRSGREPGHAMAGAHGPSGAVYTPPGRDERRAGAARGHRPCIVR